MIKNSKTFRLTEAFASVIETDVIDHENDDVEDEYQSIRDAWREGGRLVVEQSKHEPLRRALNELSNACDELAESGDLTDSDERLIYRRAAGGLATLITRIRKSMG